MSYGPSASWYEPPEPVLCCALAEDEPLNTHDTDACMADQAEAAAEAHAEREREDRMWRDARAHR